MRKRRKQLPNFYLGILSLVALIYLILNYPPDFLFNIDKYKLPILPVFLFLAGVTTYFLLSFLFLSKRRPLLVALLLEGFLLLRLNGLVNFFFAGLLIVLFVALELFFVKKK